MDQQPHTLRVFLLDGQQPHRPTNDANARLTRSLSACFDRMFLSATKSGYMGGRLPLEPGRELLVDWLVLGGTDCFATFVGPHSPQPYYLLLLCRKDSEADGRHLQWFVERILKPSGTDPEELLLKGIRAFARPFVLVARPVTMDSDPVLEAAESAFAHAFMRMIESDPPASARPARETLPSAR